MTLIIYAIATFCSLFCIRWYYSRKGHPREDVYDYANRLDQMREDMFMGNWIEQEADRVSRMGSNISYVVTPPKYNIFDPYTAKYKNYQIDKLVYGMAEQLKPQSGAPEVEGMKEPDNDKDHDNHV